jgi:hypothetical protein
MRTLYILPLNPPKGDLFKLLYLDFAFEFVQLYVIDFPFILPIFFIPRETFFNFRAFVSEAPLGVWG